MSGLDATLHDVANGSSLVKGQYDLLVARFPELNQYITENNGLWSVNKNALYDAAVAGDEWAIKYVNAQNSATNAAIEQSKQRIRALQIELEAMSTTGSIWEQLGISAKLAAEKIRLAFLERQLVSLPEASDVTITGGGTSGGGGSSKTTDPIKEQSEAFKEQNEIIEHNIDLKEKQGASEEELIQLNKEYQKELNKQANWFRSQGLDDTSEYIRDLQKEWWSLQDTIEDLENDITQNQRDAFDDRLEISEDYIQDRNDLGDWGADNEIAAYQRVLDWMDEWYEKGLIDYEYYWDKRVDIVKKKAMLEKEAAEKAAEEAQKAAEEAQRAWEEAQQAKIDALEEQASVYETLFNLVADKAQEEIDALEERRQQVEEYWQSRIDALQETNDELEEQISLEEALDDLNRARQTKVLVYKDGRFQYLQDLDQVSEAQANLEKIQREQILNEELANLEELRDKELASIDEQIEGWEEYKDAWASVVDDYQKEQDKLLVEQQLGIKLEGENWETRLENLNTYVDRYKAIMQQIAQAQAELNAALQQGQYPQNYPTNGTINNGGIMGGGGGGTTGLPYNWAGSEGLTNWVGGTQVNEQGWVMDGKVAVIKEGLGGGATPVWYDPATGKVTTSGLTAGDIILTQGGYYKITGGTAGNYTSVPWTPPSTSTGGGGGSSSGIITDSDGSVTSGWSSDSDSGSSSSSRPIRGPKFADGTLSAPDGISLVGEEGPELRLLNKGDGIIPSAITKNLWSWGMTTPSKLISSLVFDRKGQSMSISIQNLNLPSVQNGEDFVNYMKNNFWRRTLQFQT